MSWMNCRIQELIPPIGLRSVEAALWEGGFKDNV
ncbi:hypothetical protein AAZX31_11G175600 [Glycine max]